MAEEKSIIEMSEKELEQYLNSHSEEEINAKFDRDDPYYIK